MENLQLKNSFIARANAKYENKFDYSQVYYVDDNTKVKIICPEHGEFWQSPHVHIYSKYGCPKCAGQEVVKGRRKTTEQFIEEAKKVWGDKFTYDHVKYVDAGTKVLITCPIHGDFLTRPSDFLRKHGCPKCKGTRTSEENTKKRLSNDRFQQRMKEYYGDLLDFSKSTYINERSKLLVHSNVTNEDFYIFATKALSQNIPSKYLQTDKISLNRDTTSIFIEKARKIHGSQYNYDYVNYTDSLTPVSIICPKHGFFQQTPRDHLDRCGCQKCAQTHGEEMISKILDEFEIKYQQEYNIVIKDTIKRIDFVVNLNGHRIFIEFNGQQHYRPVHIFGGELQFQKQQARDALVSKYCSEQNIELIICSYLETEEEIRQKLFNNFKEYLT